MSRRKKVSFRSVERAERVAPAGTSVVTIGGIIGGATGEADRDVVPGGWSGTDDATSTAPSDMQNISQSPDGGPNFPDIDKEGDKLGDASDLVATDEGETPDTWLDSQHQRPS